MDPSKEGGGFVIVSSSEGICTLDDPSGCGVSSNLSTVKEGASVSDEQKESPYSMINGMGNHSSTVNGANAGGDHFVMVATSDDLCDEANPCGTSGEPETTAAPAPVQTKSARVLMEHAVESDDDADEDEAVDGAGEEEDLLETYPDETEEIDLVHARLKTLQHLRLPRFASHLKRLCFRQNFLTTLDEGDVDKLTQLEELDVYDNKIKELGLSLQQLPLKKLDLSFNLLRSVPAVLEYFTRLHTVYFVQNKITKITHLSTLGASLRSLELGGNRIRTIENLDALVNLQELWLGKNKITKLQNLENLTKLKLISIQSNRITKIEGLDTLVNLEEFYISHNGIEKIEGLNNNLKLTILDVASNKIQAIENLSHLSSLKELWASENQIPTVQSLEPELGGIETLETIYLEANPCQKNDTSGYRRKVIIALPRLTQLDATYVKQV